MILLGYYPGHFSEHIPLESGIHDMTCKIPGMHRFRMLSEPTFKMSWYGSPGLSLASGFEHPASALPTRFPAALGIGHGRPAA